MNTLLLTHEGPQIPEEGFLLGHGLHSWDEVTRIENSSLGNSILEVVVVHMSVNRWILSLGVDGDGETLAHQRIIVHAHIEETPADVGGVEDEGKANVFLLADTLGVDLHGGERMIWDLLGAAADVWEQQLWTHDGRAGDGRDFLAWCLVTVHAILRVPVEDGAVHIAVQVQVLERSTILAEVILRDAKATTADLFKSRFVVLECVDELLRLAILDTILDGLTRAENAIRFLGAHTAHSTTRHTDGGTDRPYE